MQPTRHAATGTTRTMIGAVMMATTTLAAATGLEPAVMTGVAAGGTLSLSDATGRNKAAARRWSEDLWGKGQLEVADDIIAADYVRHDPGDPFPATGPGDVKRIVTMLRGMFPDFAIDVEAMVAEGDMVVSRYVATATDTVGYMGMPPTGKAIRTPGMQMFRFRDGMIVESWAVRDDLGTLRQLGHLPGPAAPAAPPPAVAPHAAPSQAASTQVPALVHPPHADE